MLKIAFKLVVSIVFLVLSVWLISGIATENDIASDVTLESKNMVLGEEGFDEQAIKAAMVSDYNAQLAANKNTVGWLVIPNVCYYPIMYSVEYDYYLTHDKYNTISKYGSIFINYQCQPNLDGHITLIHGHNMKDSTMFGQLQKYLGEDFFKNNYNIIIYDGKEFKKYMPFSIMICEENNDVFNSFEMNSDNRVEYLKDIGQRSIFKPKFQYDFDEDRPVIFLSTCDYSFSEARLLVCAYLVEREVASQ